MISYYELLGMIKDGNIPKKIKLHMCGTTRIYVVDYDDEDFSNYCLENIDDKSDDFRCYLAECFLESDMFEENIEITEEDKVIGRILTTYDGEIIDYVDGEKHLIKTNRKDRDIYILKINEIIDEINKLKENINER